MEISVDQALEKIKEILSLLRSKELMKEFFTYVKEHPCSFYLQESLFAVVESVKRL